MDAQNHEAIAALKVGQLADWKRESGYHQRSKAETGMFRFKPLISPKLSLRDYIGQISEALAGLSVCRSARRSAKDCKPFRGLRTYETTLCLDAYTNFHM